jgi:hypothetical protein
MFSGTGTGTGTWNLEPGTWNRWISPYTIVPGAIRPPLGTMMMPPRM